MPEQDAHTSLGCMPRASEVLYLMDNLSAMLITETAYVSAENLRFEKIDLPRPCLAEWSPSISRPGCEGNIATESDSPQSR